MATLGVLMLLALGPVPIAASLAAARERRGAARPWSERALVVLVSWCLAQETLAIALLAGGALTREGLAAGETLLLLLGNLALVRSPRQGGRDGLSQLAPKEPLTSVERPLLAAFATLGVYLAWTVVATPTRDYDSLSYHLPAMAEWVQHHGLAPLAQFRDSQVGFYPYGWEAVCCLSLVALGSDALVALPNLLVLTILALAVYRIAVRLGAQRAEGMLAALLVSCTPLMLDKANAIQADLPLAAFFLAGIELMWGWSARPVGLDAALALGCGGMLVSVKMSGLPYLALLAVLAVVLRLTSRRAETPEAGPAPWNAPALVTGVAVAACVVGLFWYAVNLVRCGNPLGMIQVRLGGFTILAGDAGFTSFVRRTPLAQLFDIGKLHDWFILAREVFVRLGIPFLITLPLAVVASFSRHRNRWLVAAAALAAALLYWTTPYSGDGGDHGFQITPWIGQAMRYAFPSVALLGALAGAGVARLRLQGRSIAPLLALAATSVLGRLLFDQWVLSAGIKPASKAGLTLYLQTFALAAVGVAGVAGLWRLASETSARWRRNHGLNAPLPRPWHVLGVFAVALLGVVVIAQSVRERRASSEFGGVGGCLEANVPAGQPIAYVLSHQAYLLYGPRLSRPVCWVPVRGLDLDAWLGELRREGLCYLAAGPILPEWRTSPELAWLHTSNGPFVPVCSGDETRVMVVYRLKSCSGVTPGAPRPGVPGVRPGEDPP